jgi:hypothetical protein
MKLWRRQQKRTRKLRKQPKRRRVQSSSAIPMPRLSVPKTAKKRRRRNRRRARLPLDGIKRFIFTSRWLSLSLLALTVYALVMIGMDARFYLTLVPVQGTTSIPPAHVVQASGLAGAHIFAADPNQAATQIAELPGVISSVVTLSWPNEVRIEIQEDSPIAVWQENGQQHWITENGDLIPARAESQGLLVIESEIPSANKGEPASKQGDQPQQANEQGDGPPPENEQQQVEVSATSLAFIPDSVLEGALQLRELRPNIHKLYYRPSGGLSYQDGRGWRAYFGVGTDMEQKLAVYETLVAELLARGLTPVYISVSNQQKPYYRTQ